MNRDLLLFLSRLPHEELHKSPSDILLVNYWACAAEQWNATHEPVHTTICDVEAAFRLRWPQIYGGINGSELYLSFSYIDYLFTDNEDGTVSGGIFKRDGEKPTVRLNMTPVQIVELAMALRVCPLDEEQLKENLGRYDHAEEYIEAYSRHEYLNTSHPMPESEALHQKAIHMEEKATSLYAMGYYEESLEWFQKSLITKRYAGLDNDGRSFSDYAYEMMGICYDSLLDENMAETCHLYACVIYNNRMLDNNIQLSKTMSNTMISIGVEADHNIRKIDLAQAHSILIAGGSESLRTALVSSMRADLEAVAVDAVYVDSKGLSRIDEEVATIEAFASEVDGRLKNGTPESEEKVLIVSDYADYILMPGKDGRAYASRVRKSVEHIAKKGKTAGMHVILVVGRPCVDVLSNSLKKDFPTRICFKTLTGVDSFAAIGLRKACEIESNQLVLCREYEYEVLNVLRCARD